MASYLIDQGADINMTNDFGLIPLTVDIIGDYIFHDKFVEKGVLALDVLVKMIGSDPVQVLGAISSSLQGDLSTKPKYYESLDMLSADDNFNCSADHIRCLLQPMPSPCKIKSVSLHGLSPPNSDLPIPTTTINGIVFCQCLEFR